MQECVKTFIKNNSNTALLLVDIGVWPFHDLLEAYPNRAKNIGIFEPGTISLAAGLSLSNVIPTVYGISPFIAQRSLEQLKLGFAYQKIGGNFIVTGASYDFSTLGYSHYCPEDVATLRLIPGIEVLTPGTPNQFKELWNVCCNNGKPTYFRMTDHCNKFDCEVAFGKANVLKRGKKCVVITAAELLDTVFEATKELDVTLLYYSTIIPFDKDTLNKELCCSKIYVCTPFYNGTIIPEVLNAIGDMPCSIKERSVPLEILRNYGTKKEKDAYLGFDSDTINNDIKTFINK